MNITFKAYAKINLMLDIVGKLENGYHSLFMLMQSVSLHDIVSVTKTDRGITVHCNEEDIPCGKNNTAYKAAEAFFEETEISAGAEIEIIKNIPHEAGLAGGSADAAAVILALNEIHGTHLDTRKLVKIGLKVGSDVPFCLLGGTCLVQDSGGAVSKLPNINGCFFVLCKPKQGVSTPAAYAAYDNAGRIRHLDKTGMLNAAITEDKNKLFSLCNNVFEQVIDVPERVIIKSSMRKHGAVACCMTGSGPTVFGAFDSKEKAFKCAHELHNDFAETFVCESVNCGCEISDDD